MNVDSFVSKYRADWERLDLATRGGRSTLATLDGPALDDVVRLYLRVSGHLAEARTRAPDPELRRYLTALVARAHDAIYGSRAASLRDVGRGLTSRYREAVRVTLPFILASAALFIAIGAASMIWVTGSPEARAGLIPPAVRDTIRNFGGEPGDFGIGPGAFSTLILVNNIQVAFLGFALGITAGIGTVLVLVVNALNVGILAGGFTAAGKGAPFWALILPHGLLELTAIFIACGAGLRIGWAIVEPGDRARRDALAQTAREAILVVAGVVPAFVVAGFIEGYVSGSALPAAAELAVGVVVWVVYVAFLVRPLRYSRP